MSVFFALKIVFSEGGQSAFLALSSGAIFLAEMGGPYYGLHSKTQRLMGVLPPVLIRQCMYLSLRYWRRKNFREIIYNFLTSEYKVAASPKFLYHKTSR